MDGIAVVVWTKPLALACLLTLAPGLAGCTSNTTTPGVTNATDDFRWQANADGAITFGPGRCPLVSKNLNRARPAAKDAARASRHRLRCSRGRFGRSILSAETRHTPKYADSRKAIRRRCSPTVLGVPSCARAKKMGARLGLWAHAQLEPDMPYCTRQRSCLSLAGDVPGRAVPAVDRQW